MAQVFGCAADLFWARWIARDSVQARLRGRALRLDRLLTTSPFISALTLRLMPVGNNLLLNLLAGVSAVPARGFLLGLGGRVYSADGNFSRCSARAAGLRGQRRSRSELRCSWFPRRSTWCCCCAGDGTGTSSP